MTTQELAGLHVRYHQMTKIAQTFDVDEDDYAYHATEVDPELQAALETIRKGIKRYVQRAEGLLKNGQAPKQSRR